MKWYQAGMTTLDLAFLVNLQFWTGFAMASLFDQVRPPPEQTSDVNPALLNVEIILQLMALGYAYAFLVPTFRLMGNPLWRLSKKTKYEQKPFDLVTGQFVMVGLTFGSRNLLTKLQLVSRPDV